MILGYSGYNTTYSTTSTDSTVAKLPEKSRACFAESIMDLRDRGVIENSYHIKLFLKQASKEYSTCHYIFFTKDKIEKWFKELQSLYYFEYKFNEENEEYCYLDITIKGNRIQHLFVLSGIRYIYETYQNISLLLAFKAKEQIEELKDVSLLNLTSVCTTALWGQNIKCNIGHTLTGVKGQYKRYGCSFEYSSLVNMDAVRQRLENPEDRLVETICPSYILESDLNFKEENEELRILLKRNNITEVGMESPLYNSDFWEKEDNLELFMPTILKVYNKLNSYPKI